VRALLDQSLGQAELAAVAAVLDGFKSAEVGLYGPQTRQSGRHRFVSVHVLVPGAWTVQAGHDLLERVEAAICHALPDTTVPTHIDRAGIPALTATTPSTGTPIRPSDPMNSSAPGDLCKARPWRGLRFSSGLRIRNVDTW
jgi:hypothetical protein